MSKKLGLVQKAQFALEWGTLYDAGSATPADIETAYKRALVYDKKEKDAEEKKRRREGPKKYVVKHFATASELNRKTPGWIEPEWFDGLPATKRTLGGAKRIAKMDFEEGYETAVFRNGKKIWEPK